MIGFFPEPYPDELCYSLFARYRQRAGYRGRISTVRDLFGLRRFRVAVDLPSRLDHLIASLPPGHCYTTDRFIDEHTMLPFYGAFLSPERVALIRTEMGQPSGRTRARSCASVQFYAMRLEYLQYCLMCVEEDRKRWGEAYWHRIHQASGVKVCPSHDVGLEPSVINATYRFDREEFATLEGSLPPAQIRTPQRLDQSDRRGEVHLAIARDAWWLLNQRGLCSTPAALRRRYLNLLYDRGLATSADRIRLRVLRGEFASHYGRDFLQSLGCDLGHEHFFNDLMSAEGRHARHPIDHLLFIHFLRCSAREFFLLPTEKRQPFGAPPWPCLNPASEHYLELRIEECTVEDVHLNPEDVQRNLPRRPVGEFACDCGFVYRRIGPDTSEEDRYKKSSTAEFGPVWESKLRALRRGGGVYTSEELARLLNVSPNALRRHERRLGLHPRQENDCSETFVSPPPHHREQARLREQERRRIYREQWLSALEENPQIDLPTLKAKLGTAYNWLRENDYSWVSARTPPRRRHEPKRFKADWEARDVELSAAVRRSAARLMDAPGRPVRVSARAIGIDTGRPCLVLSNDARLPLTNRALMEVAESSEAWAIRRIRWAVDCYHREGACATRTDVLTRARVGAQFKTVQSILAAAEEGVRSLRAFLRKTD
jgi:Tn7-like transposition protein D/TniQ